MRAWTVSSRNAEHVPWQGPPVLLSTGLRAPGDALTHLGVRLNHCEPGLKLIDPLKIASSRATRAETRSTSYLLRSMELVSLLKARD
jgi:hypothetical protein